MTTVNLSCVICAEFYKNSDSIISTSCGHVFHLQCLNEWRARSMQCPQCRGTVMTTNKLYLNFEECSSQTERQVNELKIKLENSIKESSILQQQLDSSEREFLSLHDLFSKKEDELKECFKKIDFLTMQNSMFTSEIEFKTVEIHKLQETLKSTNPQAPCTMLEEEIKILKERIKLIEIQLQNEIRNTTQLTTDKMRLESKLEFAKSIPSSQVQNSRNNENKNIKKTENTRPKKYENFQTGGFSNRGCIQSVVIKNVQGSFVDEEALRSFVFKLSDLMDLFFTGDDIEKVTILERRTTENMILIAKFKTVSLKSQFLSKKDRLKQHPEMKDLILNEYVSDNTNSLFHYARTLKPLGFKHIYCRNNIVFVRKDDGGIAMRITSRDDIDKLKNEIQSQQ